MEVWKSIKGYEDFYSISSMGRVKSFHSNKERFLKPSINSFGYYRVNLSNKGKIKQYRVQVLMAITFLDEHYREKKLQCNHIDGDKGNNRLSNLEVITKSENEKHAFRIGLKSHKGNNHNQRKINSDDAEEIRRLYKLGVDSRVLADKYGLTRGHIYKIKNFDTWN